MRSVAVGILKRILEGENTGGLCCESYAIGDPRFCDASPEPMPISRAAMNAVAA